jgi:hypothetical protein
MRSTKLVYCLWFLLVPLAASAVPPDSEGRMIPEIVFIPQVQYMSIIADREEGKMVTKIQPFNSPRLDRFTKVIWTNNANVPVRIKFGKGPKCEEASETRLRRLDWRLGKACYITQNPIPPKGVLDTTFTEQGQYPYEVEFMGEKATESGVITVY